MEGARSVGAEVRLLVAARFDPLLRAGYRGEQPLEPDLHAAQAQIAWAGHLVWVYPTSVGRHHFAQGVYRPRFPVRLFQAPPSGLIALGQAGLAGRSAEPGDHGYPAAVYRRVRGPGHHQMQKTILGSVSIHRKVCIDTG